MSANSGSRLDSNLQVNDRSFVVPGLQQTGTHFIVRPGRVGLKLDRAAQIFDGFRILSAGAPAPLPCTNCTRYIFAPAASHRLQDGRGPLRLSLVQAARARTTLCWPFAIPSFGSTPVAAAFAAAADFCRPTYPSDASFCISLEVSSGPAGIAGIAETPVESIQLRRRWFRAWPSNSAPGCAWRRDRPRDRKVRAWAP